MATMARLIVEDLYLPLTEESRAMLIKSLKDIASDLGTHGRIHNPSVVYIEAPKTRIAHPKITSNRVRGFLIPIQSSNCAPGPDGVGCDG